MDLTNISTIKKLCREFNIRPSKKLGQNFLISKKPLKKMIATAELKKDDVVLEIGPGFGVLTQEMAEHTGHVIAVEKDKRLVEYLRNKEIKKLRNKGNVEIINDDILKISINKLPLFSIRSGRSDLTGSSRPDSLRPAKRGLRSSGLGMTIKYKIIANLPYQITSPVLWKFLHEQKYKPSMMVLMIQKEVAERIVAKPGKMSILSVLCQFYADCEMMSIVGRENFWPQPEIDSAIIRFTPRQFPRSSALAPSDGGVNSALFRDKEFLKLVKAGFSAKRKMLKNNLSKGLKISANKVVKALKTIGLSEKIRAQELSVEKWIEIYQALMNNRQ